MNREDITMSQERKRVAMTRIIGSPCRTAVNASVICVALSIGLWAQTTPAGTPTTPAAHAEPPAQSPDVSKAHDSTLESATTTC